MPKRIESYSHSESKRKNIPTEQLQNFVSEEAQRPINVEYQKRNPDLDPQLIWKGKYDSGDVLSIDTKPLYIQEKIHPKAIIENLRKKSMDTSDAPSLFEDTFGIPPEVDRMDFYKHDQHWTNRMILGDSLQVMSSLANREGLREQVQCIYIDPPYGIKFNSNFQWSTTSTNVKDGKSESMTRDPEMVKAFRDTWANGVHSYLTYLRDRLLVAHDLLTQSGSIFVQIGTENVHRVRVLLDEIFGEQNYITQIVFRTTSGAGSPSGGTETLAEVNNYILWYAKDKSNICYHQLYNPKSDLAGGFDAYNRLDFYGIAPRRPATQQECTKIPDGARLYSIDNLTSQSSGKTTIFPVNFGGNDFTPNKGGWKTNAEGMNRLLMADRIASSGKTLRYVRYLSDFNFFPINNNWDDTITAGFASDKIYIVQTNTKVIQRCILMTTNPGDLVLDPTCGSGTTAYVAEQWGRRWITIDTSRVSLALSRARLMGAKYPYYLLKDSVDGRKKELELTGGKTVDACYGNLIKLGFVYERAQHIQLKAIARNSEIEIIYNEYINSLDQIREKINNICHEEFRNDNMPEQIATASPEAKELIKEWWQLKYKCQKEIDTSIERNSEFEFLVDKPYIAKDVVRVTGPFTVESLSPHRVLSANTDGKVIDPLSKESNSDAEGFASMIIENLRTNGVQQSDKSGKLDFTSVEEFPGDYLCAEGCYLEGDQEKRVGILIGPEFGTLTRADIVAAAREAVDCGFDLLVAAAFHFDAQSSEICRLGRLPIMKVMMNTDLMMGEALKGKGNLFVAFGEPDIVLKDVDDDTIQVIVNGVDIFFPNTGEVRSSNKDGIACWFVDTDYDQESFFVRQAYFLGAKNPYESLKKTLKADIDEETWKTLHSNVSRPFKKPKSGCIAVKVINHLGDEVMKVLRV